VVNKTKNGRNATEHFFFKQIGFQQQLRDTWLPIHKYPVDGSYYLKMLLVVATSSDVGRYTMMRHNHKLLHKSASMIVLLMNWNPPLMACFHPYNTFDCCPFE